MFSSDKKTLYCKSASLPHTPSGSLAVDGFCSYDKLVRQTRRIYVEKLETVNVIHEKVEWCNSQKPVLQKGLLKLYVVLSCFYSNKFEFSEGMICGLRYTLPIVYNFNRNPNFM